MRLSDNQGVTHQLPCSKGGQQGDGLETICFAVTVRPSIGRVCERHLGCKVVGICDDIFIIARLSKNLSCAAEMKKILKADLDMDLNVSTFNVFFPGTSFSLDTARSALDLAVRADPFLADLAAMGAGVSTDGMRVAGVPVGVDAWVKNFDAKKARSVITDVAKLDVVSDGLIHTQLLNSGKMRAWPSLGVTQTLLFFLNLWHRWMPLLSRRCVGMKLEEGMSRWIGLHIFANLLT